jgi:hypothetical protein
MIKKLMDRLYAVELKINKMHGWQLASRREVDGLCRERQSILDEIGKCKKRNKRGEK